MPMPRVVQVQDVEPHGLRCACDCGCSVLLNVGDTYTDLPLGMVQDIPLTVLVCWACREHEQEAS